MDVTHWLIYFQIGPETYALLSLPIEEKQLCAVLKAEHKREMFD